MHQDSGYQVGWYDAYSFFIPMTECGPENGALALYPGTKNFGHLGDVGGIAPVLPPEYPYLQATVQPGDVLIMHAGTWHYSTPNLSGAERIYLEVNIRAVNDPGTKTFFDKPDQREWILNVGVSDLFVSSRDHAR
jgi:ectoine hydroxylase-related dioxygenase (phytanoyl-CoA dioxygenase family)